jgi:hypothetical protein
LPISSASDIGVFFPALHGDLACAGIHRNHDALRVALARLAHNSRSFDGCGSHHSAAGTEGKNAYAGIQRANAAAHFDFHRASSFEDFHNRRVVVLGAA